MDFKEGPHGVLKWGGTRRRGNSRRREWAGRGRGRGIVTRGERGADAALRQTKLYYFSLGFLLSLIQSSICLPFCLSSADFSFLLFTNTSFCTPCPFPFSSLSFPDDAKCVIYSTYCSAPHNGYVAYGGHVLLSWSWRHYCTPACNNEPSSLFTEGWKYTSLFTLFPTLCSCQSEGKNSHIHGRELCL